MDATVETGGATSSGRASEQDFVVERTFAAPVARVYAAWTQPDLLMRWWAPSSIGIAFVACETDVRAGGGYRFAFSHPHADGPMEFFGRYLEVEPHARLVWTNEEAGEAGPITTVTFEPRAGGTFVTLRETHPSKASLDAAIESGACSGFAESFSQLDALLAV